MTEETLLYLVTSGVVIASVTFVVQAYLVYGIYRTAREMHGLVSEFVSDAAPVVSSAKQVLVENGPKVSEIGTRAVEVADAAVEIAHRAREIAGTARRQSVQIDALLTDIVTRAKVQVERIDGVVGETADRVEHAAKKIEKSVMKPVREVNGFVTGVRAAMAVYSKGKRPSVDHATQDEEMFI